MSIFDQPPCSIRVWASAIQRRKSERLTGGGTKPVNHVRGAQLAGRARQPLGGLPDRVPERERPKPGAESPEVQQTRRRTRSEIDQHDRSGQAGQHRIEVRPRAGLKPADRQVVQPGTKLPRPVSQPLMQNHRDARQNCASRTASVTSRVAPRSLTTRSLYLPTGLLRGLATGLAKPAALESQVAPRVESRADGSHDQGETMAVRTAVVPSRTAANQPRDAGYSCILVRRPDWPAQREPARSVARCPNAIITKSWEWLATRRRGHQEGLSRPGAEVSIPTSIPATRRRKRNSRKCSRLTTCCRTRKSGRDTTGTAMRRSMAWRRPGRPRPGGSEWTVRFGEPGFETIDLSDLFGNLGRWCPG